MTRLINSKTLTHHCILVGHRLRLRFLKCEERKTFQQFASKCILIIVITIIFMLLCLSQIKVHKPADHREKTFNSGTFFFFLQCQSNVVIVVCTSRGELQTGAANDRLGTPFVVLICQNLNKYWQKHRA